MLSENIIVGPIMEKNVKSIMGIMALSFSGGENVTVQADGADEDRAVSAIKVFLS